jgi:NAD(P)-dependent dehydrogenase (short-subunit alcohol dehydrogenase family)
MKMKNIIISGANQGIGYYMVEELLRNGYNVTVLDLEIENLKKLTGNILPLVCDISDADLVKACVQKSIEHFGSVDCAVHNACLCTFDSLELTNDETYHQVFNVNYFGAINLSRAVLPLMKEKKRGKIIFTSSGVGVMGFLDISPYASTKGAIEALAKCLNIEYSDYGITFHIFHPPLTNTKSASPLPVPKEFMADPKKVGAGLAKRIQKKSFIICHSFGQKAQTMFCYMFPIKMGKLMSKLTKACKEKQQAEKEER